MGIDSTPLAVRDSPPRDRGPDLTPVGTDLVICEGEAMTFGEYRREREASTERRDREAKIGR